MAEYNMVLGGLGVPVYKKDNLYIKATEVPGNIVTRLELGGEPVSDEGMKLEAPLMECVFCKGLTKISRLINQRTIALCDEHYHNKTTGQVIQRLRESSNEVATEEVKAGHGETFKSKFEE